jgi:hypothetical protein
MFYVAKKLINTKKELSERNALVTNNFDQIKDEFRGFTSLHGFSSVLNTSNPFVKGLWVFFILVLFSFLIQNGLENINDYYQYTVITKIEHVNENPMKLPAITICLFSSDSSTNATLGDFLYNCSISEAVCEFDDFYSFTTRTSYSKDITTCYVLNRGRNSSGHSSEIKSIKTTGVTSGYSIRLYLPNHYIFYYINDAYVEPTSNEIEKLVLPGIINSLKLEKIVETKLEYPFNNCWESKNLPDSPLVRKLSEANITYRQVNCVDLCFQNFVQNYALEHRISEDEARRTKDVQNYDKDNYCNHLCPLECKSTEYRISESKFSLKDFRNSTMYGSKFILGIQKKLNITINSTEEFNKNNLEINIFFDSLKYTKISQTPKTTLSALVSNLGGSSGLFLDLSFMSASRAIEFILGIIFKL